MQLTDDDFILLDKMGEESNARMSEMDFVKRLLPHLIPNPEGVKSRVDIFVAAAGHANRMIDVYNNQGTVIFTVPPLVSPTPMTIRDKNPRPDTDIGEITAEYDARVTVNAPGALNEGFVSHLMALNYSPTEKISSVYALMWAKIYLRYNIPLELKFGDVAPAVAAALKANVGEFSETVTVPTEKTFDEPDDDDFEPL